MADPSASARAGFASEHKTGVMSALQSIRSFSDAMDRMHSEIKGDMDMNATDVAALRLLIIREQREELTSPHDIAEHLRITTASVTKLLDRLSDSGHIQRKRHPHDRRSRVIVLTGLARETFYQHFGGRLNRMREVTERYSSAELAVITRYLDELAAALPSDAVGAR